jgi:ADP-ribose pyrophosphatase YjhB (NUDIX family)
LWEFPGGKLLPGESPEAGAVRECLEETGLTVRITRVLDVVAGREHPRGADFVIVYAAEVVEGDLAAGDDADQAEWFPSGELPPLAFRATQLVLSHK